LIRPERGDAGKDDGVAARVAELRQRRPHAREDAVQVGLDHPVPARLGQLLETALGDVRAGRADEYVDRALGADLGHQPLDRLRVRDVEAVSLDRPSCKLGLEPLVHPLRPEADGVDACARRNQPPDGGETDPAAASGDDRGFAAEGTMLVRHRQPPRRPESHSCPTAAAAVSADADDGCGFPLVSHPP
jgi:hypothetical protein